MRAHTLTSLGTFVRVHTYSLQYGSWLYAYTCTYSLGCTCALIARRLHTCTHTYIVWPGSYIHTCTLTSCQEEDATSKHSTVLSKIGVVNF